MRDLADYVAENRDEIEDLFAQHPERLESLCDLVCGDDDEEECRVHRLDVVGEKGLVELGLATTPAEVTA